MKKSVQQYKTLVERIQSGEEVTFGQMEKVFAPAFLENFLRRILGGQERDKLKALNRNAIAEAYRGEDIDPDQLESSNRQLVAQEIELVRMVSGALGVRPTLNDLSNYLQESIRSRNWELMNKILSLSQEGKLERGIIERAALDDLVSNRTNSYQELKKAFPDLQFSRELVVPAYEQILKEGEFDRLHTIRTETGVPIPEQPVLLAYQDTIKALEQSMTVARARGARSRELNQEVESGLQAVQKLQQITHVPIPQSPEVHECIASLSSFEELEGSPQLERINDLFGLFSDEKLSLRTQELALERGNINVFANIYQRSPHKLSSGLLKNSISALYDIYGEDSVIKVVEVTGVAPTPETWKRVCSKLLRRDRFLHLERLSQVTGEALSFEQSALAQELSARSCSLVRMREYVHVLGKAGITVPKESINQTLLEYVRNQISEESFTSKQDVDELQAFYDEIDVKLPVEIANLQIVGVVGDLERRILALEIEHSKEGNGWKKISPLNPVKRENMKEYHVFAKATASAFRDCLAIIKNIKKNHPGAMATIIETDHYLPALELMLAQASQEEKILSLQQLVQETGIAPSRMAWRDALAYHLSHFRSPSESQLQNARSLLERITQQTGMSVPVAAEDKEAIVEGILKSENAYEIPNRLTYAQAVLGGFEITPTLRSKIDVTATECLLKGNGRLFEDLAMRIGGAEALSSGSKQRIKGQAVKALQEMNVSRYDFLHKSSGISFEFDESDRERVRMDVITGLMNEPKKYKEVQAINERLGTAITATPSDLKRIVAAYFEKEGAWAISPHSIADSLGQQLDKEQIADRVIELVNAQNDAYYTKELANRTGITPDASRIDREVGRAEGIDAKMTRLDRFKAICPSYVPSPPLVTQLYTEAYQEDKLWSIQGLLRDTRQIPPQDIVNSVLEKSWDITLRAGEGDWANDNLTEKLLKEHKVNPPYNPTQLKERILSEVSRQWFSFNGLYNRVQRANAVHQFVPEFSLEEQQNLLERIEYRVRNSGGYTPLRRDLDSNVIEKARQYAPKIITDPALREQAARKAAELFASESENMYRGFAYATLTGVQPKFTPEEYGRYTQNLQKLNYQMRKGDFECLQGNLEKWKPEGA